MNHILIKNSSVSFPIYNVENQSFRHHFLRTLTGGKLSQQSKHTTTVDALQNINLEITHGERICLLGHNGSGKSTMLRLIAGVYSPSQGMIEVCGRISTLIDPALGMDFEASGIENIYLRGLFLGKSRSEVATKIEEIVDFSELGDFIYLPVRTYSSGMVMRLAFAISTCFDPEILLLDEWLSVGDPDFREKATLRLNNYVSKAGILVLATNDEQLAGTIGTRIIRMESGSIVSDTHRKT